MLRRPSTTLTVAARIEGSTAAATPTAAAQPNCQMYVSGATRKIGNSVDKAWPNPAATGMVSRTPSAQPTCD